MRCPVAHSMATGAVLGRKRLCAVNNSHFVLLSNISLSLSQFFRFSLKHKEYLFLPYLFLVLSIYEWLHICTTSLISTKQAEMNE